MRVQGYQNAKWLPGNSRNVSGRCFTRYGSLTTLHWSWEESESPVDEEWGEGTRWRYEYNSVHSNTLTLPFTASRRQIYIEYKATWTKSDVLFHLVFKPHAAKCLMMVIGSLCSLIGSRCEVIHQDNPPRHVPKTALHLNILWETRWIHLVLRLSREPGLPADTDTCLHLTWFLHLLLTSADPSIPVSGFCH